MLKGFEVSNRKDSVRSKVGRIQSPGTKGPDSLSLDEKPRRSVFTRMQHYGSPVNKFCISMYHFQALPDAELDLYVSALAHKKISKPCLCNGPGVWRVRSYF